MPYKINNKVITIRLKQTKAIRNYLNNYHSTSIIIPKIVYHETMNKIWSVITDEAIKNGLNALKIRVLVKKAKEIFLKFFKEKVCNDDVSMLVDVKKMYYDIWKNPNNKDKLNIWSQKKRKKISEGPPSGNDLKILSTAISFSKNKSVTLLTLDYDFIIFEKEIKSKFNTDIENGWIIPY